MDDGGVVLFFADHRKRCRVISELGDRSSQLFPIGYFGSKWFYTFDLKTLIKELTGQEINI
jgi:hypothetical protein